MDGTVATTPKANNVPCPVAKLPPELREMIYQYYFKDMKRIEGAGHLPEYGWHYDEDEEYTKWQCVWQISNFKTLKPYLSMLHLSSVVRSETISYIYKAAFTNVWFNLEVDRNTNNIELMKEMLTQLHEVSKDVKFGLHFTVSDHIRETFSELVDSFFNIHVTDNYVAPTFVRCKKDCETKSLMLSSNSDMKIEYTYKSEGKDFHRLWMFGTLARLDWSRFECGLPPPLRLKSRIMDNSLDDPTRPPRREEKTRKAVVDDEVGCYESEGDGIDVDLDSENEAIAFNSDDDDNGGMIFGGGDEVVARDDSYDSEDESRQDDSEKEAISDDDEDEIWIDIEL